MRAIFCFRYINSAPQWLSFNAGNWEKLETSVRRFVAREALDVDVYTGVHGQMSLRDDNNNLAPLSMYVTSEKRAFPVPKYFWKIIYDPETKLGAAFVGVNDPYLLHITEDLYLCEDISQQFEWISWKPKSIRAGVSYACEIDELRRSIDTIPTFDVVGILK